MIDMNKVFEIGRLTRTPELAATASGTNYCNFNIAVNRRFKNNDGIYEADFINCIAWKQTAEFICKHFEKGSSIAIVGRIQTKNYEKDGQKVYVTEVVAEEVHFVGGKAENTNSTTTEAPAADFPDMPEMPMPDNDDLPF
jgi:single-strand DNA-binding protein